MQGPALSDYIKRAESADDPSATVLQILRDVSAGRVKREDINAHYSAEYQPKLNSLFGIFGAGNLFKAQRMDFGSWLDGKEYASDFQAYLNLRAVGDMVRKPGHALAYPGGMELFICKMVLPSPATRKSRAEFLGVGGADKLRQSWTAIIQREGWNWRAS